MRHFPFVSPCLFAPHVAYVVRGLEAEADAARVANGVADAAASQALLVLEDSLLLLVRALSLDVRHAGWASCC